MFLKILKIFSLCVDLLTHRSPLALFIKQHEELEHLALIEKICGKFPDHMIDKSSFAKKYFTRLFLVEFSALSVSHSRSPSEHRIRKEKLTSESQNFVEKFPLSFKVC
jgi:hypothetical protein